MFYQLKSVIKHRLRSTNQHGVHSPFVYDLITMCFYNKTNFPEYTLLKKYRNLLIQSKESIKVTDFGAGSRIFTSDERNVAAIVTNAGITSKRQRFLFRLVRYFGSNRILELGTSLGLGTVALGVGNPTAEVVTVEGCPNTARKAQKLFDTFKLKNIQFKNETFEDFLATDTTEIYDLVYIDGNHNEERTLQYFGILLKKAANDSVFIFDDIYWSPGMTRAWQKIIAHPKVTVSIDTFQWGLIFFRKEQEKQHFSIRL